MLTLLSASWENFKAYTGKHFLMLDNEPGLYLVRGVNDLNTDMGSNGAAKSTLFDIIAWVFWAKTFRDETPGAAIEPWTGERPTKASVKYRYNDIPWEVLRGRNPNTLLCRSADEAGKWGEFETCDQARVDEIFPLSFAAFRCSVILPQFGESFLDMTPEPQARLISETMGLDFWLRAADLAGDLAKDARSDLEALASQKATIAGRRSELSVSITEEDRLLRGFAKAKADRLAAKHKEREEAERELAAFAKHVPEKPVDDIAALEADLEDLREHREVESGYIAESRLLEAQMQTEAAELRDQIDQMQAAPDICPACNQKVSKSHFFAKIAEAEARLSELASSIDETVAFGTDREIVASGYREAIAAKQKLLASAREFEKRVASESTRHNVALQRMRDKVVRLKQEEATIKAEANPHTAALVLLTQRLDQAANEADEVEAKIVEADSASRSYGFWETGYRQIRLNLIDDVLAGFETAANENADALGLHGSRIEFATEKETAAGKLSRGFSVLIYPPGMEAAVKWKSYCGGEVQRWQLAARFAFSELVLAAANVEPNIEILDEPTQHLSPEGVESLLLRMRERAVRLGRQIWLVDQHVFGSELFDGLIDVHHDAGGSKVKLHSRKRSV